MNFNKKYEIILDNIKYELNLNINNNFIHILLIEINSFK